MKVTLDPPSEEEDDTVVESTESESDPADDLFKHDQKNLVSAKDPVRRRGAVVLNQNSLDVNIGQEEEEKKRDNIKEGANLPEAEEKRKTPEQKCDGVEEEEENHSRTSLSGERRHPVENGREEGRKETKIDKNWDNCAAGEEAQRILQELEIIKRRISEIEHDVLKRIVL